MNDRAFHERLWSRFASLLAMQVAIDAESPRPLQCPLTSALSDEGTALALEVGCGMMDGQRI